MRPGTTAGFSLRRTTSARTALPAGLSAGSDNDLTSTSLPSGWLSAMGNTRRPRLSSDASVRVASPRVSHPSLTRNTGPPGGASFTAASSAASRSVSDSSAFPIAERSPARVPSTGRPAKATSAALGSTPARPRPRSRVSPSRLFDTSTRTNGLGETPASARIGSSHAAASSAVTSSRSVHARPSRPRWNQASRQRSEIAASVSAGQSARVCSLARAADAAFAGRGKNPGCSRSDSLRPSGTQASGPARLEDSAPRSIHERMFSVRIDIGRFRSPRYGSRSMPLTTAGEGVARSRITVPPPASATGCQPGRDAKSRTCLGRSAAKFR